MPLFNNDFPAPIWSKDTKTEWEKLPDNIKALLSKYHSHAEIAWNKDPDQIVYTEAAVIKILKELNII